MGGIRNSGVRTVWGCLEAATYRGAALIIVLTVPGCSIFSSKFATEEQGRGRVFFLKNVEVRICPHYSSGVTKGYINGEPFVCCGDTKVIVGASGLQVNGVDCGAIKDGDTVLVNDNVWVNGTSRGPVPAVVLPESGEFRD